MKPAARYLIRLAYPAENLIGVYQCEAIDENDALEQAETEYPGCEFLSCECIEYPEYKS